MKAIFISAVLHVLSVPMKWSENFQFYDFARFTYSKLTFVHLP